MLEDRRGRLPERHRRRGSSRARGATATRGVLRWGGVALAGLAAVAALVVVAAAVTDRPSAEPLVVDRDAPEVVAFLAAERAWMAHHGLDFVEHDVEVDRPGVRVRVLEVGEGAPVVFVPGGPGEAAYFAPLLEELDGHRFLLVNLPGGGASDGVDLRAIDDRSLARETLDAVYDHFGVDAAPIVGNSRGGLWALSYGLDRPGRVTAGVKLGVPAALEGTAVPGMLRVLGVPGVNRIVAETLMRPTSPEAAAEGLELVFGHPAETVRALPRQAREFQYAHQQLPTFGLLWRSALQDWLRLAGLGGWNPDVEIGLDDLSGLDHPILMVWPSDDPFGDPEVGRAAAAHAPDAQLQVAGVGHLPWLDDPAGVAGLLTGFLDVHGSVTEP